VNPGRDSQNKIRRLVKLLRLERRLAEKNPSAILLSEIADTQRRMGSYADAATTVEQLISKYPSARSVLTLVALADLHRRAGHNEALKAALRQAMQLDPSDGAAQNRLAGLLSDVGQVDDAVRVLRAASQKEPNNPVYDLMLGGILTKYGRNDEAIKLFETLLKRHGDNEEVVKIIRPSLSVIYVNQGDYAKGEAELEQIIKRFPEEPGLNNDLGYLYAEQGKNLDKSESMIRKALQEEPDNRAYLDSLGWVLFKRGKAKEALEALQKAVERMKAETEQDGTNPDATILEHLGDVLFQLQQLDKASDAWRQAARCAEQAIPPEKRLPEIRKKLESLEQLGPIPKPSSNRTP
jgi:tetratricopeptide (TPR) repeat protein